MAEETSFMGKIMNSIGGMLIGFLLIPVSFFVVGYSSCRERTTEALRDAQAVGSASATQPEYATGKIQAAPLGDPPYVRAGNYLQLSRSVQIYAYKEIKGDKEKNEPARCETHWTSSPDRSLGEGCRGKSNPNIRTPTTNPKVSTVRLTADGKTYTFNYPQASTYGLPSANIDGSKVTGLVENGGYFYMNQNCAGSPYVGCERISYSGYSYDPGAEYTIIGKSSGNTFAQYTSARDNKYLAFGAGNLSQTMESISSSDFMMTLILFIISVACLGGGMAMIVGPLLSLIEYIPIIGGFGAGLIRVIFFIFAFVIMAITYTFLRYWWVILILVVLAIAAVILIGRMRKSKAEA